MSGASSRKRGHGWEVLLGHKLSEHTGLDVRTTRSLGASYGADLATVTGYDAHDRPVTHKPDVLGWSCEAKAVKRRDPAGWLRQADEQKAPGTVPVVLWTPWHPSAKRAYRDASAFVFDHNAPRGWWEMPIREWVAGLGAEGPDVQEAADRAVDRMLSNGTW